MFFMILLVMTTKSFNKKKIDLTPQIQMVTNIHNNLKEANDELSKLYVFFNKLNKSLNN